MSLLERTSTSRTQQLPPLSLVGLVLGKRSRDLRQDKIVDPGQ